MNDEKIPPSQVTSPSNPRTEAASHKCVDISGMAAGEIRQLVHKLQVRQIELERQNEELRRAQIELAHSRDRFNDLYDFAPVGYLTMKPDSTVIEANLTAATMLGLTQARLVGRKLTAFIEPGAQDALSLHQRAVACSEEKQTCDLVLRRADGRILNVRLETNRALRGVADERLCLSALIDTTDQKHAEEALAASHAQLEQRVTERTAALRESERTARAVVDGLTARIAIVDEAGAILAVNERWQKSADHAGVSLTAVGAGVNYLAVCDAASRENREAAAVAAGIREVLAGKCALFETEYPCLWDGVEMWSIVRVTPFPGDGPRRAVIAHEDITSRVLAERTLRESEEHYRQLVQGLPVAVYAVDAQGRLVLYNAAAVKLWGREPSPRECWNGARRVLLPNGKPLRNSQLPIAIAMRQDEPIRDFEMIIQRPDGGRSHVLSFPDPLHDSAGAVTGAINVVVDITALKTAESALRASTRNLRTLSRAIEQSPAGVLITSPAGIIEFTNPTFAKIYGYSSAEMLGENPRLLKSGVHEPAFYREIWKTISAGRDWRGEICNRKKDGELAWAYAVIGPILDEAGATTHFVEVLEDITERRRAQVALREGTEQMRTILNTVADAIITIDRLGEITSVNPATVRMFGYTEAEMIGQNLSLLLADSSREDAGLRERSAPAEMIRSRHEAQGRRRDGTLFPIELAIAGGDQSPLLTGVIRDITEQKRLEAEVLRISEEERRRVSADLHDGICQELIGIQFLTSVLRGELTTTRHPLAAQVGRIHDAIRDAAVQTRQVARGMTPVVRDGNGLAIALRQLTQVASSTHRMRCVFECKTPVAIEDPLVTNELYRITQEAIHNAIRHGQARRVTVRLQESAGCLLLTVMDNGSGLPKDISRVTGMGLHVMKYRAGLIGRLLVIQSRRRGGTEVICRVQKLAVKL